jgi:hypothetical protein
LQEHDLLEAPALVFIGMEWFEAKRFRGQKTVFCAYSVDCKGCAGVSRGFSYICGCEKASSRWSCFMVALNVLNMNSVFCVSRRVGVACINFFSNSFLLLLFFVSLSLFLVHLFFFFYFISSKFVRENYF